MAALATGPVVDRFGARWALGAAYGLLGITFALMSVMDHLWQFYALQLVARSMNTGVVAVATAVIIPNWFVINRGRALSLSSLGFPIGAAVMPLYVQFLISLGSWRTAAFGVGIVILVVSMLPSALFIRRRPEDLGLSPDGGPIDLRKPTPTAHRHTPMRSDVSLTLAEAARQPAFYLLTIAGSFWWFGRAGLVLHLFLYLTDGGLSDGIGVSVLVVHSAAGAGGTLLAGFLRDRYDVRYVLAVDFGLNSLAVLLLLVVGPAWLALGFGLFYGIVQGVSVPSQRLIFADYFGRRHLGSIEGIVRATQNVSQAAGPLAAAFAYDAAQSYQTIFLVFVATNLIAAMLVLAARAPAHMRREQTAPE